jgi:serine/threonine-protein kinase
MAHIEQQPPRPRSINPNLPSELEAAIVKGLEKDPARRWQTAAALLDALSAISTKAEAA